MTHQKWLTLFLFTTLALPTSTQQPLLQKKYVFAFDLHGVVFKPDASLMWQAFKKTPFTFSTLLTLLNPFFIYDFVTTYMTSDSVEEIIVRLLEKYPHLEQYYDTAMAIVNAQRPILGTVDIINQLKAQGYTLYVFSNIGKESLTFLRNYYPEIFKSFAGFVFTQPEDNWIQKPQQASYEKFLRTFDLKPENIIFIDDKKVNLTPAQDMGFITLHFTSPEQLRSALQPYIGPIAAPILTKRIPCSSHFL